MRRTVLASLASLALAFGLAFLWRAFDGDSERVAGATAPAEAREEAESAASKDVELESALAPDEPARTEVAVEEGGAGARSAEAASAEPGDQAWTQDGGLRGRVLWPDGRPVPGAEVSYEVTGTGRLEDMPAFARTLTDKEGRFRLPRLNLRRFFLHQEEARVVAWRPTDDGRMFAAREVIDGLDSGDVEITPAEGAAGLGVASKGGLSPSATRGDEVKLVLAEVPTVRGLVVDGFGTPIAGAEVALRPGLSNAGDTFREPTLAAARAVNGSFSLPVLDEGTFQLEARAEGYTLRSERLLDLPADARIEQRLVMDESASISGVVLAPDGVPVADASVWPLNPEATPWAAGPRGGDANSERTDKDGRFAIEALPPGLVELRADMEGWAGSDPFTIELAPGESLTGVELFLTEGGAIEGLVLKEDGSPAPGAAIMGLNAVTMRFEDAEADGEGRFRLEALRPGSWQLQFLVAPTPEMDPSEAAQRIQLEQVEVVAGETTHVTIGGIREEAVTLTGLVTFGGEPFQTDLTFMPDRVGRGMAGMAATETDADGRYSIELEEPGSWLVVVGVASDLTPFSRIVDVAPGGAQRLDLALPAGRIEGRVLKDDEPAEDVLVRLQRSDGLLNGMSIQFNMPEIETLNDGTFAFEGVAPGVYDVIAGGQSRFGVFGGNTDPRVHPVAVTGGLRVGPDAEVTGVEIHLSEAGRLAGRVMDAAGKPVPSATVWFRDESGRIAELMSLVTTDSAGRFAPQLLAPGSYTVLARSPTMVTTESVPVQVAVGETTSVKLTAAPGIVLRLGCEPADGAAPLGGTRVELWDGAGRPLHGLAGGDLIQTVMSEGFSSTKPRLGPLAPGSYRVRATAPDGRSAQQEVNLDAQSGAEVEVSLRLE